MRKNREFRGRRALSSALSQPDRRSHASTVSALSSLDIRDNEINVRGMGSRFAVTASNFVLGTTVADIEAAILAPHDLNNLLSYELVQTHPTVTVKLVFKDRRTAESMVERFDGKMVTATVASSTIR